MEQVRLPIGGLNLDDSPSIVSPEDWIDAVNISTGRFTGKGGEKENFVGTRSLGALSVTIDKPIVNSFTGWSNSDAGKDWTLGASPSVTLGTTLLSVKQNVSRRLLYNLESPITGRFDISFNTALSTILNGTATIRVAILNGSTVIEFKQIAMTATNQVLSFSFVSSQPITGIGITAYHTTTSEEVNINTFYSGGHFELEPESPLVGPYYTLERSTAFKTKGNYAGKVTVTSGVSFGSHNLVNAYNASAIAAGVEAGTRLKVSAKVYVPSGSPIAAGSTLFRIAPADGFAGITNTYTLVSEVQKTVSDATNQWQLVEAVYDLASRGGAGYDSISFFFTAQIGGGLFALNVGGNCYVDEFEILITPLNTQRTFSLSSLSSRSINETDVLDENSRFIGKVRSGIKDINYLFFYNPDPDKNCILKLENDAVSLVLRWSGLGFEQDHTISGGVVDKLLYFTHGDQPRCVNTERYSEGATPTSEEEILLIRRGPAHAPSVAQAVFPSDNGIQLEGDYQFAYQYEYIDGQMSVTSPYSDIFKRIGQGMRRQFIVNSHSPLLGFYGSLDTMPALVKKIHFIVRDGNNGTPLRFASVEASATDKQVVYEGQSGTVVESMYLKQSELVPLRVKAMALAMNRLWLANYVEGYDTPTSVDLSFELEEIGNDNDNGFTFPANSEHNIGIVLKDEQGRSSGVVDKGWKLRVPNNIATSSPIRDYKRKRLKVTLSGALPSWASSFSIVMTKDLRKTWFAESLSVNNTGSELYVSGSDGSETYSLNYSSSVKYNRIKINSLSSQGIGYTFLPGDMVIMRRQDNGVSYGPLKIERVVGDFIYTSPSNIGDGAFQYTFQIFRPALIDEGSLVYYEVATGRIANGQFEVPTRYVTGTAISRIEGLQFKASIMGWSSNVWNIGIGKPYIKTDLGQVDKSYFFKHSSTIIPGTTINGLSEFNVGDEGSVDSQTGGIQTLQPTSKEASQSSVLLAICATDTYSIYIGESRVNTGSDSFLVASAKVIGDTRKQNAGFGTVNPEGVHEEDGHVFWYDKTNRSYCRYATNGIFPVSEYKVVSYFERQAQLNDGKVVAGYDPLNKMIFVTFENAERIERRTIGFSVIQNRWVSFYNFAPDAYISGSNKMYSVVGGTIYAHDNQINWNSFYGVEYDSAIELSFNDNPAEVKEWSVVQIQGSPNMLSYAGGDQVTSDLKVEIRNEKNQFTDILSDEFDVSEDLVYGEIRGDINTGGVVNGDRIYSGTLQCRVMFSGGSQKQISFVKAGFEQSLGHKL
jgi:hypothetical protein